MNKNKKNHTNETMISLVRKKIKRGGATVCNLPTKVEFEGKNYNLENWMNIDNNIRLKRRDRWNGGHDTVNLMITNCYKVEVEKRSLYYDINLYYYKEMLGPNFKKISVIGKSNAYAIRDCVQGVIDRVNSGEIKNIYRSVIFDNE